MSVICGAHIFFVMISKPARTKNKCTSKRCCAAPKRWRQRRRKRCLSGIVRFVFLNIFHKFAGTLLTP